MNLDDLSRKAYQTYLARVQGSKRLGARAHTWSLATAVASVSLTFLSIYALQANVLSMVYSITGVSVVILVLSTWGSALRHSARERDMVHAYLRIQEISDHAYSLLQNQDGRCYLLPRTKKLAPTLDETVSGLCAEYRSVLDSCENHTSSDYYVSKRVRDISDGMREDGENVRVARIKFDAWSRYGPLVCLMSGVVTAAPLIAAGAVAVWAIYQVTV